MAETDTFNPETAVAIGSTVLNAGTGIANAAVNYQNFDLQRQAYERSVRLQDLVMAREDNAIQRRLADMKAAGINPVLAAGSPAAASQPMRLEAPQNQARWQNPLDIGAYSQIATLRMQQQLAQASIEKTRADIEKTNAEAQRLKQQTPIETKGMELANQLSQGKLTTQELEQTSIRLDNLLKQSTQEDLIKQAQLTTQKYGLENTRIAVDTLLKQTQADYIQQLKAASVQSVKESQQRVIESGQRVKNIDANTALTNLKSVTQAMENVITKNAGSYLVQSRYLDTVIKIAQLEILKIDALSKKIDLKFDTTGLSTLQQNIIRDITSIIGKDLTK